MREIGRYKKLTESLKRIHGGLSVADLKERLCGELNVARAMHAAYERDTNKLSYIERMFNAITNSKRFIENKEQPKHIIEYKKRDRNGRNTKRVIRVS